MPPGANRGGPPGSQQAQPPNQPPNANSYVQPISPSGLPVPSAQQAHPIPPAARGAGIVPQSPQGRPLNNINDIRGARREYKEGNRTVVQEPGRTIIREGNQTIIRHSEADRFRYGARNVQYARRGNDNVTTIMRPNGNRVVNVVDANGLLLRRSRILPDGREIIIIDNRGRRFAPGVGIGGFFINLPPPVIRIPRDRYIVDYGGAPPVLLYQTLEAPPVDYIDRPYSLDEILYSPSLRDRMPRVDLNTVTFETGAWELEPDQIEKLAAIAETLNRIITQNPQEVFLIEGHTDAVGNEEDNLSLSDRRAESVAIALTQQFGVPAENLTTQGYGEQYLLVPTQGPEPANRRVAVRRITPLLNGPQADAQPPR
jgi:outer membrane protein OmpA-like peptidoglycan-associated protein